MNPDGFHNHCDNKGATLTVIITNDGYIFGGFTTVPWTSPVGLGVYKSDNKAFIYSLSDGKQPPRSPSKFGIKSNGGEGAVCHDSDFGPTFGCGHDIVLWWCNNTNKRYCNIGNTYELPPSYKYGEENTRSYMAGSFNQWVVKEVLVYLVYQ